MAPASEHWGRDRGTPLDRHYIEAFLAAHAADVRGDVIEVKDAAYTARFGSSVATSDVLDIDGGNRDATVVGDISRLDVVPAGRYDCFILTQTLQFVETPARAVAEVYRVLRPGGAVLCTVPSIIRIDRHAGPLRDYWRFTPGSCHLLFDPVFGRDQVQIEAHGNLVVASAFLTGLAAEELHAAELSFLDERFPILVTVRAVKAPRAVAS
jgi:SAM-dependent methyltransferase